jgi:tetratricopeptide (TPR) repeat protein
MFALSLALTPLLLSALLLSEGRSLATTDPDKARDRIEQSAALNPFADLPYLEAADIARRQGMTPAALAALAKAREREPKEWVGYALLLQTLLEENLERAQEALRQARELTRGNRPSTNSSASYGARVVENRKLLGLELLTRPSCATNHEAGGQQTDANGGESCEVKARERKRAGTLRADGLACGRITRVATVLNIENGCLVLNAGRACLLCESRRRHQSQRGNQ